LARYYKPSHPKLFELSDEESSYVRFQMDKWERNNPLGRIPNHPKLTEWHGELARQPQLAAWIFGVFGFGLLASDDGLERAAPLLLLGLPIVSFSLYFYFNNVNENWKHSRDLYEASLVDELLAGDAELGGPWG